jgi:hypothetical protein
VHTINNRAITGKRRSNGSNKTQIKIHSAAFSDCIYAVCQKQGDVSLDDHTVPSSIVRYNAGELFSVCGSHRNRAKSLILLLTLGIPCRCDAINVTALGEISPRPVHQQIEDGFNILSGRFFPDREVQYDGSPKHAAQTDINQGVRSSGATLAGLTRISCNSIILTG